MPGISGNRPTAGLARPASGSDHAMAESEVYSRAMFMGLHQATCQNAPLISPNTSKESKTHVVPRRRSGSDLRAALSHAKVKQCLLL